MAKYTPRAFEINLQAQDAKGFVIEVGSLFEAFCRLHDQRDARDLRYTLVTVLVFTVLAKLAGENHLRGIAHGFGVAPPSSRHSHVGESAGATCDHLQPHSGQGDPD